MEHERMLVREIQAKAILSVSQIYDYVINPYVGCQHGCSYCYARFMKRFTGHKEPWGEFVDVKVNAPALLEREITRKKRGSVWVSGVCDPYQPLEKKYELTRQCLAILKEHKWPVAVQTRSPLVLRDMNIFKGAKDFEVGLTITTTDDSIRRLFEPNAPPIETRIKALDELHKADIRTYAMIAPMLPGAEGLASVLAGKADYLIVDRMNYHYADRVYHEHGLDEKLSDQFFARTAGQLVSSCRKLGIECTVV
ncbi:MAG: radical SAM protein [Dehalococcoidia bacterium]|nr:radical SAM protein [Dehalococcoidia bacterium]MDD5493804.1 radical SAM protein [Dehalococcoidia bacterium]